MSASKENKKDVDAPSILKVKGASAQKSAKKNSSKPVSKASEKSKENNSKNAPSDNKVTANPRTQTKLKEVAKAEVKVMSHVVPSKSDKSATSAVEEEKAKTNQKDVKPTSAEAKAKAAPKVSKPESAEAKAKAAPKVSKSESAEPKTHSSENDTNAEPVKSAVKIPEKAKKAKLTESSEKITSQLPSSVSEALDKPSAKASKSPSMEPAIKKNSPVISNEDVSQEHASEKPQASISKTKVIGTSKNKVTAPKTSSGSALSEKPQSKEKSVELSLDESKSVIATESVSKTIAVNNDSTRPIHGLANVAKEPVGEDQKSGVRRKGPIGAKSKKVVKATKSEFGMRMCIRCPNPFEPVEENEVVCPKCKDAVNMRFSQLFGDEDPYSPQPTLRTNKIARVIFRNNKKNELPEHVDRDIAEESLEPIDRYDDE